MSRARREYRCKDCLRIIHIEELYYRRDKDDTIYCMECYEPRRERWLRNRDSSGRKAELLADVEKSPKTARFLADKYGMSYTKWLRDLKMAGHPVWRTTTVGGDIVYCVDRLLGKQRDVEASVRRWFDGGPRKEAKSKPVEVAGTSTCTNCGQLFRPTRAASAGGVCTDCRITAEVLELFSHR